MSNSKTTKRALLTSVMALVLCFAMLTGTTFAWFTDTETSGNNKIVAGNLDVELLMWDGSDYIRIDENSDPIFGANSLIAQNNNADTLWEPGKTQVAFLAIRNAGNLALKYNIFVDVTDNGLADALEYAIVPVKADNVDLSQYTWATIKAQAGEDVGNIVAGRTIAAENGCLDEMNSTDEDANTDYFALAIHMKEDAGNEYEDKDVIIDINVVATQVNAEEDAFDPSYDEPAPIVPPDAIVRVKQEVTVNDNSETTKTITVSNATANEDATVSAEVPAGVKLEEDVTEVTLVTKKTEANAGNVDLTADGVNAVAYDVKVEGVASDNEGIISVTLKAALPVALTNVTVCHDGNPMEELTDFTADAVGFYYDAATGDVIIKTKSFSNFTFVYNQNDQNAVSNADELKEAIENGGCIVIADDIDFGGATISVPNSVTLLGDGNIKISNAKFEIADNQSAVFENFDFSDTTTIEAKGDGALSFTNCEFNVKPNMYNGFSRAAAIIGANQYYTIDLYLDGCTFNYTVGSVDKWNAAIFMWSNVDECTIKNCTFNDYGFIAVKLMNVADGAEIVFEGNTFNMCKNSAANYYNNNAVQIMPQHDNELTVKFTSNTFTGDYKNDKIVATIEVMHGSSLSDLTFEQSGNTINGEAVTKDNFAINATN